MGVCVWEGADLGSGREGREAPRVRTTFRALTASLTYTGLEQRAHAGAAMVDGSKNKIETGDGTRGAVDKLYTKP
jgi:hypothetical protein